MLKKKLIAGLSGAVIALAVIAITVAVFSGGPDDTVNMPGKVNNVEGGNDTGKAQEVNLVEIKWKTDRNGAREQDSGSGQEIVKESDKSQHQDKETD